MTDRTSRLRSRNRWESPLPEGSGRREGARIKPRHAGAESPCSFDGAPAARRPPSPLLPRAALVLATLALATLALAARADAYLYWGNASPKAYVNSTGITRANLDGTGVQGFIPGPDPLSGVGAVAVDGAYVYWANQFPVATIGRANLDGTGVNQSFIAGARGGVAVDATHIYWTSEAGIGRANLDGTGVNQSFIVVSGGVAAIDATHIYWTNFDAGTIGRANLDGTGVNESFITGASPEGVAVDAGHVYWANIYTDTIARANLDGTGVDLDFIAASDPVSGMPAAGDTPSGVAVEGAHIYWTTNRYPRAAIGRANLDGTDVAKRFIATRPAATGLAVDALGPPPGPLPSNKFSFGGARVNRKRGSAKLTVKVAGPGRLELARTKNVKGAQERAQQSGKAKLTIKARGKARTRLKKRGKAKVKAKVTYTPRGGASDTKSKKIKLVKR